MSVLVIDSTLLLFGVIVAEQVSQSRPQARRNQALAPSSHVALCRAPCGLLDRRQLVARARGHVQARRPRRPADPARADEVAERFLAAARHGDLDGLLAVLHPDAELVTDGGGKATAARRTVAGADRIARFVTGIVAREPDADIRPVHVNAAPGAIVTTADGPTVVSIDVDEDRVTGLYVFRNPDKLTAVRPPA